MTDSAAFPRTRSSRSSLSKRRSRAAAAGGGRVQSRAAAGSGRDATVSEASRDEHTLDLFGGSAARKAKPTAKAESARSARATARGGELVGEQADLLSGFAEDSPARAQGGADARFAADAAGMRAQDAASAGESASAPSSSVESASADAGSGRRRDTSAVQAAEPATAKSGADDATVASPTDSRRSSSRRADSKKQAAQRGAHRGSASQGDATRGQAARGQTVQGEAAHDQTPENPARRSSAAESRSADAPAAQDTANIEPTNSTRADPNQANPESASPVATRAAAIPARRDAGASADTPALAKSPKSPHTSGNATPAPVLSSTPSGTGGGNVTGVPTQSTPPAASPTSFPASASPVHERQTAASPAASAPPNAPAALVELDAHLRPLADRIRALQSETADLRRAADTEMRRVNRLLLALGVVVLMAIVALVVQAMQLSRQRDESAALQQRIDRLVAVQATQEATVATLSQRQDELGAQVDRLTSRLSSPATPVKRPRRGRGH